ncbi:MAG: hypothetical protein L3K16_04675 [Thermoplasmata archaeon]|nr:hypothetical protein [Thermoplasmata archaeon]
MFVLTAVLGPFYWGLPYGELLYGQDSTRLVQPFAFNSSPLIPYSYLESSTFPVPDFSPYFYIDGTLRLFASAGAPAWLAERLLLCVVIGLAASGIVALFRALDAARVPVSPSSWWVVGLAVVAYVYNPFTLTVTFWHFENWTLFFALLPWLLALAVRLVNDGVVPLRFSIGVTLLGIYLAPGAVSSFAVCVGAVVLWTALAIWTSSRTTVRLRRRIARTALLLGVALGIEGWSFVPFVLVPNVAYTSNNYVTPANLVTTYLQLSTTSRPYPVLTLTAFSWLANTPSAYAWIAALPVIAAAAVVFPVVVILGALRLRTSRGSLLVYAVGLTLLPLMIGGVAPLDQGNIDLLHLGGPFLVIAGGYYFLGTAYVLLAIVGLAETLRRVVPGRPAPLPSSTGTLRPSRWRRAQGAVARPSTVVAVLLVLLLGISASPFAAGDVYQTRGPNTAAITLPTSYPDLAAYFGTPSSGPDYYVLLLPMSAQDGIFDNISGHQFLDSSDLLASYIPYPVLAMNNGPTAAALEESLAAGPPANLDAELADLHIRYVVVNPFANTSARSMNEDPAGDPIDYAALLADLPISLGSPAAAGEFSVYSVPGALPLGWSSPELVGVDTPTDAEAIGFVGAVTQGPAAWISALRGALWAPSGDLPGWDVAPSLVAPPSAMVAVPAGFEASVVDRNGSWGALPCAQGACSDGNTSFQWSGSSLGVRGAVQLTSNRSGDFLPTEPEGPNGYCPTSNGSVGLYASRPVHAPAFLTTRLTFSPPTSSDWATVTLTQGTLSLQLQAYQAGPSQPATLSIAIANNDEPYAWRNVELPAGLPLGVPLAMTEEWNATSAAGSISNGSGATLTTLTFGNLTEARSNPGFNTSGAPVGPVRITNATESVVAVNSSFCIESAEADSAPDAAYLVTTGPGAPPGVPVGVNSSIAPDGDVTVSPGADRYVVLGFPDDPLWTASVGSGTGIERVAGAPMANVFALSAAGGVATVTFHFRTDLILGLEASWFEAGGLAILLTGLTVQGLCAKRARRASAPPSTPAAPPSGPPPAHPP